jgi:ribosomal protein L37E
MANFNHIKDCWVEGEATPVPPCAACGQEIAPKKLEKESRNWYIVAGNPPVCYCEKCIRRAAVWRACVRCGKPVYAGWREVCLMCNFDDIKPIVETALGITDK